MRSFKKYILALVTVAMVTTFAINQELVGQSGYIPQIPLWGVKAIETCPALNEIDKVFC
jgi:hypothetical protein